MGGRGGSGGLSALPESATKRISYQEYKQGGYQEAVSGSYDKASKTIEVKYSPRIDAAANIIPSSVVDALVRKASSSKYALQDPIQRRLAVKRFYESVEKAVRNGKVLTNNAEKWQVDLYKLAKRNIRK